MALSPTIRSRLETQGYVDVDERTLASVEPWLRWSPALCTTVMAIGTALGSEWVLWGLAPFAALGAVFPRHPFDYLYNYGLRRFTGTAPLPPNGAPRRFACPTSARRDSATSRRASQRRRTSLSASR